MHSSPRPPALRALAQALMFAVTTALLPSLQARELNGEDLTIEYYAMDVLGGGRAAAVGSLFLDGGIWVAGNSQVSLTGSQLHVRGTAPGLGDNARPAWGLNLNNSGPVTAGIPRVDLDNSKITVADRADHSHYSSGIGAYLRAGELHLRNDSSLDAANVGVIMHGSETQDHTLTLRLEGSHLFAGRGAGIEIAGSHAGAAPGNRSLPGQPGRGAATAGTPRCRPHPRSALPGAQS